MYRDLETLLTAVENIGLSGLLVSELSTALITLPHSHCALEHLFDILCYINTVLIIIIITIIIITIIKNKDKDKDKNFFISGL